MPSQTSEKENQNSINGEKEDQPANSFGVKETCNYFVLLKDNTTFHGIRDCFDSIGLLRIAWTLIIIAALGATFLGCFNILIEYYNNPVVVSYYVQEKGNLPLPDLVICPFNRFNRTYLESHNISDEIVQYLEFSFPGPRPLPIQMKLYNETKRNVNATDAELQRLLASLGNMTFTEFVQKAMLDCSAFFEDPKMCESTNEIMNIMGKCYRVPGFDQYNKGFGNGHRIIIKVPKSIYYPGIFQMLSDGMIVNLAERGRGIGYDTSFVPTGTHALMALSATYYDFKSDPPRFECEENANSSYSQIYCVDECFIESSISTCNCILASASTNKTHEWDICSAKQLFECVIPAMKATQKTNEEMSLKCQKRCKPRCVYWHYAATVSYAHFPSEQAKHFLDRTEDFENLKSTIVLDVFFNTFDYSIIKHLDSMTLSSFLGQVGGQISLWIGGSIMSLIQLIIYLTSALFVGIKLRKKPPTEV